MSPVFDAPINSNDLSLDRVLAAGLPVILFFFNPGSASQKALEATLESLARQHAGELLVVKIHASENPQSSQRFGIRSTPAVVTVKDGQTLSQAENITTADLEKHAAYVLGKGQRPVADARPSTATGPGASEAAGRTAHSRAPTAPVNATDATFSHEAAQSGLVTLVDFWAPWCGPCRMTDPILKKLASEMAGRLKVVKVNVDENPRLSQQYGVQSIPTMLIMKDGKVVDRWVGALPEPAMRSHIARFVS